MTTYIELIKQISERVKQQAERTQQYYTDPCWQYETAYIVGQWVIDKLNRGEIEEWQIPMFAIESRQGWHNVCEDTAVNETPTFTKSDSDNE